MGEHNIPFNKPYMTGKELHYISEAHMNGILAGDGPFNARCQNWLENQTGSHKVLLTHSCTAALEMAALLLDIAPGDEIIMPSYTFVSTANAFALRGGIPVFVDIRNDTLNIDESLIEGAITSRTRAIVVVHYAGVACEMDTIMQVAKRHSLKVIEDAAQGVMATYKGKPLGSIGDLGCYSFHETKNIISGEGGALLVNDRALAERAEMIREKGTDRSRFFRGHVDKYTWQDTGSSFLPGELIAAFLWAQLEDAVGITQKRMEIWCRYHEMAGSLEAANLLRRPVIPDICSANAHMYYVLLKEGANRDEVLANLKRSGVLAVFHYVPLHESPAGIRLARAQGSLKKTETLARCIIRLPLWIGLDERMQRRVIDSLANALCNVG